jgi:hypothetical protein
MYLWSNLTQITLSRTPYPITNYCEFIDLLNTSVKNFSMITFFDNFQFWGIANRDGMIEGNFYTNYQDYSTISNKQIFQG